MGELFAGWRLVPPRLRSSWPLLSLTAVGVLVAAALLAATPLYASALSTLGLQFRLERALGESALNTIAVERLTLGDSADVAARTAVDAAFDARVGWLGPERLVEERSSRLLLDFAPGAAGGEARSDPRRQPWNAFLFWLSGYEQHVTVTAGRLPAPDAATPEVVLLDGFQRHAALGDTLTFALDAFDDCGDPPPAQERDVAREEVRCTPAALVTRTAAATVVGFVRPNDPDDARWEIFAGSFETPAEPLLPHADLSLPADPAAQVSPQVIAALAGEGSMPLLTAEGQLLGAFAAAMADVPMRHRVGVTVDIRALSPAEVTRGIEQPQLLFRELQQRLGLSPALDFPVARALGDFRNTRSFEQVSLLLILLQVAGIVVYYVVVVASMLVERQAEEIAVLRSRGAGPLQLVGLYLMEGALIAVVAATLAPWLAAGAVAALGYTPTFHAMTGGQALPVSVTPAAYALAAGGAALALLALLLPAAAAAGRGVVEAKERQARPPGRSLLQRYYLDLGAVVVALILLWQLGQRGSVFDPRSVGGWSADPLLLLSPLVLTVAVAALVLRLYPPLLRWTAALLLAGGGTAVALGLRRAARAPATYARLTLLLLMAISVGTFAASFGPTVDRSRADRVRYDTGVDVRGALPDAQAPRAVERIDDVRALDGARDAAHAFRGEVRSVRGTAISVLALDPARATAMLSFRDDFADEPLGELMRRLQSAVPPGGGVDLSEGARAIRVAVRSSAPGEPRLLWARYRDADGAYLNSIVAPVESDQWVEMGAPLPERGRRPLTFVGFRVTEPRNRSIFAPGELYIDDVREVLAAGDELVIEDFERAPERFGWRMFGGRRSEEQFELSDEQAASGERSARWSWPAGAAPGSRMLLMNDPGVPLAAVVNPAAEALLGAGPDGEGALLLDDVVVPVRVRAVADLFPTLDPEQPSMVLNFEHLSALSALLDVRRFRWPNELWVSTDGSLAEQERLLAALTERGTPLRLAADVRHRDGEIAALEADPMLRASGSGILTAAFGAVLGLAMLGFVVTLVLGAHGRVVEFAVLRAVGSSQAQILRAMALEWGAVLAIGAAIGVLLGRRVAAVMLSFLDVTEGGERVVPPFILQTDWLTLALGVAALGAVATLALLLSWASTARREAAVALRVTR